jgi:hypothetical protein
MSYPGQAASERGTPMGVTSQRLFAADRPSHGREKGFPRGRAREGVLTPAHFASAMTAFERSLTPRARAH